MGRWCQIADEATGWAQTKKKPLIKELFLKNGPLLIPVGTLLRRVFETEQPVSDLIRVCSSQYTFQL